MSRHERRSRKSVQKKVLQFDSPAIHKRVAAQIVLGMSEMGPDIRQALIEQVGGEPTPGQMADAILNCAARFRETVKEDKPESAYASIVSVMWLAQALAMALGKIPRDDADPKAAD